MHLPSQKNLKVFLIVEKVTPQASNTRHAFSISQCIDQS